MPEPTGSYFNRNFQDQFSSLLERLFHWKEPGATLRTEVIGEAPTFLMVACRREYGSVIVAPG